MASYRDRLPVVSGGGAVIKSIQRGAITMPSQSQTVTIAAVDLTKAYVMAEVTCSTSSAVDRKTGTAAVYLSSSTTLTVSRAASTGAAIVVRWQVVEYISGVSVQRGSFYTSSQTNNVNISAVDINKSFLTTSRRSSSSGLIECDFVGTLDSTTITYFIPINNGSSNIYWEVVTYV